MKIEIKYYGSWGTSFLDGSNDKPLTYSKREKLQNPRKLFEKEIIKERDVTHNTVMGILYRLTGDVRKLYTIRKENGYFNDIDNDDVITFNKDHVKSTQEELVSLKRIQDADNKSAYIGMLQSTHPVFDINLFSVLNLSIEELCDFILDESYNVPFVQHTSLSVSYQFENLENEFNTKDRKISFIDGGDKILKCLDVLKQTFPDEIEYKKGKAAPINLKDTIDYKLFYCSALYIQAIRLEKQGENMDICLSKQKKISGFAKKGFTPKAFFVEYANAKIAKAINRPKTITVRNGELLIDINVDKERAMEIKDMIESSGIACFYVGKKGTAYVKKIII